MDLARRNFREPDPRSIPLQIRCLDEYRDLEIRRCTLCDSTQYRAKHLFGHVGDGNLHVNILKPDSMDKDTFLDTVTATIRSSSGDQRFL